MLHQRVNEADSETRGDLHIARGLRLRSLRLGLTGIADVVEFHRVDDHTCGVGLPNRPGCWQPFPFEYKKGRPKPSDWDRTPLCAQALCLEEMLETTVPHGAIFYGKPRRRDEVVFESSLREQGRLAWKSAAEACLCIIQGRHKKPRQMAGSRADRCHPSTCWRSLRAAWRESPGHSARRPAPSGRRRPTSGSSSRPPAS